MFSLTFLGGGTGFGGSASDANEVMLSVDCPFDSRGEGAGGGGPLGLCILPVNEIFILS